MPDGASATVLPVGPLLVTVVFVYLAGTGFTPPGQFVPWLAKSSMAARASHSQVVGSILFGPPAWIRTTVLTAFG